MFGAEIEAGNAREDRYRLVKLAHGGFSVHSLDYGETFHPVVGPAAEAEALYVGQLRLRERFAQSRGEEFVVWDVGLGSAGNTMALIHALRPIPGALRVLSFDHTLEPLRFALRHCVELPYLQEAEPLVREFLESGETTVESGQHTLHWSFIPGSFPAVIASPEAAAFPKPHAIMFDAFSPATNPEMWTQPLFARLYQLLAPRRLCALPTYSRSTLLRATLLLAGFFVGQGDPIGKKEETTIAANSLELLSKPLTEAWLRRARRSGSAEPMWEPVYRQAPLLDSTWQALQKHPQFAGSA